MEGGFWKLIQILNQPWVSHSTFRWVHSRDVRLQDKMVAELFNPGKHEWNGVDRGCFFGQR